MTTFSVVIAAYQAADVVGAGVQSALEQSPPPLEVIVSDDGSTDDLAGALSGFGSAVRMTRIEHGGEAAAKNAGASLATGDFLAFLDADDRFLPGRLQAFGELLSGDSGPDVITTDAFLVHNGAAFGRAYGEGYRFVHEGQREAIMHRNFVLGNAAIRRSRFLEVGGFDPAIRYTTDWDLCIRLILSGARVAYIDKPLAEYHVHPGSMSANRIAMSEGRLDTIRKTAQRSDLSAQERKALESARESEEVRLAREVMKLALLEHRIQDARLAAREVFRSRRQPLKARAKGGLVFLVAPLISRLHRLTHRGTFATVGDQRFKR